MTKIITIEVDTNDGDYQSSNNKITLEEIELIKPIIEAIKNFKPYQSGKYIIEHAHNFPYGECLRRDLGEKSPQELYLDKPGVTTKVWNKFIELLPYCEYGFHTIESIKVREDVAEEILL